MLSKCHLFGHGDAYYQYPDDLIDPDVYIIDDLPQDVQEAIMEMNMLNHDFFMFRNAENEQVCVVYRRTDGNYGLIEPGN